MGVIRGFFLVIAAVLLFLSLISMTFFWTLSSSLSYDNVQKEASAIVTDFFKEANATSAIDKNYDLIQSYCINNSDMDYVFRESDHTYIITCNSALQGKDAMIKEGIKSIIHDNYYADSECRFFDCFKKTSLSGFNPLFLISERTYNYVNGKFYFFLFISLILTGALLFFIEKKTNLPILTGILLIISSLLFIKLDAILSLFSDKTFFNFLWIFFSNSYLISLKILIAGVILLIIGIILKIFKVGFFISNLISKFKKPQIAKEKPKPAAAEKIQKQQNMQPAKKSTKKIKKSKSK